MSVVGWCISGAVGGVEGNGLAAEDEGSVDLDAAEAFGGGWSRHLGSSEGRCYAIVREYGLLVDSERLIILEIYRIASSCETRKLNPGPEQQ